MKSQFTRRGVLKGAVALSASVVGQQDLARAAGGELQMAGKPVEVEIFPFSAKTVQITMRRILAGGPEPIPDDGALIGGQTSKPAITLRSIRGIRTLRCGDLRVKISEPLTFRIETKKGRLVQELKSDPATGRLTFELGEGPLLGLGQGGQQFDRRGSLDEMGSGQGAYHLSTHGARVPIQLAIGTAGWAVYIHRPLGIFDLSAKQGIFQPASGEAAEPFDVFVIGAADPQEIMAEYAKITGLAEMVPLWSFGYQQSHRTLGPPEEILQEAKLFREKKLPCDAMIYLGTGFCPNGWNADNGEFNWNAKAFPDPAQAIKELQSENFKVVVHVVLEGHKLTGGVNNACSAPPLPSGRTADKHWPPERQVSCYWPVHKPLLDLGLDGWWPDQGDGLDAASRLARNRMYFEGTQMYRPNERVYALHRNAYAGMQRYGAFLWSGDVQSRWETLKTHVPVGINTGLSGIPYWGTDIGGFVPTQEYTGELFVRWFQFAAFNPLFRSHGRDWRLHLPWGWTVGEIGVPETPSYHPDSADLHNPAIEPICKKYLELRYRLLPYIYSAAKETCETGVPMIRALWLHYPNDPAAVVRGDEYLFGRDLLVAPVVEKGATSRTLYLPHGDWYDFWTREKVRGGREVSRPVDLETTPLYVRAGAIVPLGPIKQHSGEKTDAPITLHIHPGADGSFSLYEDDGKTFSFRNGEYTKIEMHWRDKDRQLSLSLAKGSKMLTAAKMTFNIEAAGESQPKQLLFEGRSVTLNL